MNPTVNNQITKEIDSAKEKIVKAIVGDATPANGFLSPEMLKQKMDIEVQNMIDRYAEKIKNAIWALVSGLDRLTKEDPEKFPATLIDELKKFAQGEEKWASRSDADTPLSLVEFYGLSDETLNYFFDTAADFFKNCQYREAADILFFLTRLKSDNPKFLQALGSADYYLENYEEAISDYVLALNAGSDDPYLFLYICSAYEKLNQSEEAIALLETALNTYEDDPDLIEWKKEAEDYLNALKTKKD